MKLSDPLLPVRQDVLLRRYESPRIGIRRVQATAETQELLKLAGFKHPPVFDWYDVPVRENEHGQLVVDVPCPGRPSGCRIFPPGEDPVFGAEDLGPIEIVELKRFRAEVRIDDTWIQTFIVDAADKGRAGEVAMKQAFQRWGSEHDYDVWSVTEDDLPAEGEAAAGVSPGSGVSPAPIPGGRSGAVLDPGLTRYASPAFAVPVGESLIAWAAKVLAAQPSERSETAGSPRGEKEPRCPGCGRSPVGIAEYNPGDSAYYWACACPERVRLVGRIIRAKIRERELARTFRIPMSEDEDVVIRIMGRVNRAIPAPYEIEDWASRPLDDVEVHGAVAALHRCRALSDFEVPTA